MRTPTSPSTVDSTDVMLRPHLDEEVLVRSHDERNLGEVLDLVVDPKRLRVTNLVVGPKRRDDLARLVPVEAIARLEGLTQNVRLRWTAERFEATSPVERSQFLEVGQSPQPDEGTAAGINHTTVWPPFVGAGNGGLGVAYWPTVDGMRFHATTTYDQIGARETELRTASEVVSNDGHLIGHFDGFAVHLADGTITHVIVRRGHGWHGRVTSVPADLVAAIVSDRVRLRCSKDELDRHPGVETHRDHSRRALR